MTDLRGLNVGGGTNDIHGNTFVFGQSASPAGLLDQTPPPIDKWQGRDRELIEIRGWMAAGRVRLIGFVASGGFGKATLAAKVYAEEAKGFEKTLWFNFSQGYSFRLWSGETLKLMGFLVEENIGEDGLVNALVNAFAQKRYLMVLDNLETLMEDDRTFKDQGYPKFLQHWLERDNRSLFLITSRERPKLLEPSARSQWKSLGGLTTADGVKLLNDQNIQGTLTDLEAFVKVTGGHPLLLTLAIGWLRNPRLSERADVVVVLRQDDLFRLGQLVGLHKDVETSVGAVLGESVARLDERLKGLWLALSVYRGAFGLGQAVAMEATATLEDLWNLVDRSLLQELPERQFEFLPLLQQFAAMQAGDLGEAHLKAIAYYQAVAKPMPWKVLEDGAAYLSLFHHCCQLQQYDAAFDHLRTCDEFLILQGHSTIQIEHYGLLEQYWRARTWQPEAENQWKITALLTKLGTAYYSLGEYQQAIDFHQQSLEIDRKTGDRHGEAASLGSLGNAYNSIGEYQRAFDYQQQSLRIKRQIGNRHGEATSLIGLGNVYQSLGEYQRAIDYQQQSLAIQQQIGDRYGESDSLINLGNAYGALGEYQRAIGYQQQSLKIKRQIGDRNGEAKSLMGLGNAYESLGEHQRAIDFFQQSLKIKRQIGDRGGEGGSLVNLGSAHCSLGNYQEAIELYQQGLKILHEISHQEFESNALWGLGSTYRDLKQNEEAINYYSTFHFYGVQ